MSFNNILQDNINAIPCLMNSFPGICPSITTTPSTEVISWFYKTFEKAKCAVFIEKC